MAAFSPCRLLPQTPDTLSERDLQVAGLPTEPDTSTVRRVLGTPQHIWVAEEPNEDGVLLTRWMYRGLVLNFDARGGYYSADISAPAYHTGRGVQVGDSLSQVRRAYGQPAFEDSGHLLYARANTDVETRGVAFFFEDAILRRIIIGKVISVE